MLKKLYKMTSKKIESPNLMLSITSKKGVVYAVGSNPRAVFDEAKAYWRKNPTTTRRCVWRFGGRTGTPCNLDSDFVEPRLIKKV